MALSPAQRYQLEIAGRQSPAVQLDKRAHSQNIETSQISVRLMHDLRRLKSVQSMKRKAAIKREILPFYADYVTGVLAQSELTGHASKNDIVGTVLVWRIDAGDYKGALEIAQHMLKYDLPLPARFERDVAALLVTEIANAALYAVDLKQKFDPDIIDQVADMTADADMSDDMKARLYKAQGLLCHDNERALKTLKAALEMNPSAGVKSHIRSLEKRVSQSESKGAQLAAGADQQNDRSVSDAVVQTDLHPRKNSRSRKYRNAS